MTRHYFLSKKGEEELHLNDPTGNVWRDYLEDHKLALLIEEGLEPLAEYRKYIPLNVHFHPNPTVSNTNQQVSFSALLMESDHKRHLAHRNWNDDWEILCHDGSGVAEISPLEDIFIQPHLINEALYYKSFVLEGFYNHLVHLASELGMVTSEKGTVV